MAKGSQVGTQQEMYVCVCINRTMGVHTQLYFGGNN